MKKLKQDLQLEEIMYLSTCNRVEFIITTENEANLSFIEKLITCLQPEWDEKRNHKVAKKARFWEGINAVNHLIEVASSLDSMVLGEREIITQVRKAYNFSKQHQLSGDVIRLIIRQTIETAKKVYTETSISEKSVSVVSLAHQALLELNPNKQSKVLFIGAGVTNQNMAKFLKKDGFKDITVFNRTLKKAEDFAAEFDTTAYALSELKTYKDGFDIIISCTGSNQPIIDQTLYNSILDDASAKIIIDLAIPNDIAPEVISAYNIKYISVASVKKVSDKNLLLRKKELLKARNIIYEALESFKSIFELRQLEIKMRFIPDQVKAIRSKAISEVFSKDLEALDENSKEVLDKILDYMEKKYVSVPMVMAKEMLIKN